MIAFYRVISIKEKKKTLKNNKKERENKDINKSKEDINIMQTELIEPFSINT